MSKSTSSMTGPTFDRKMIQIQEQFRWFVSAVANVKLNFNSLIGTHEFPPFRANKTKKFGDNKFDSSNSSVIKGNSVTDSEDDSGGQSPTRVMLQSSLIPRKSQIASLNFKTSPLDPKQAIDPELPDIFSPVWQNGFVWKGVYFKLYSKREGLRLKKEMKVMKHLGVECLQTDTSIKLDILGGNINDSVDTTKFMTNQIVNIILPLMCIVESSSWVLFGSPVFPIKKSTTEDQNTKLVQDASQIFKKSFLLNNLTPKNFKIYHTTQETTTQHTGYSSIPHQNHYLLLSNVSKIAIQLPRVDILFTLNQESNAHVTFLDYPKRGLIDVDLIKKVLGYAKYDISTNMLLKKDPKQDNKPLYFDILKFKRRGWLIQMIIVAAKDSLPSNFTKNRRAMEFLSHSEKKRTREIRGNVLVCASLLNKETLVHPYFISDQLATHSFLDEPLEPSDLKTTKQTGPNLGKQKYSESIAQQTMKVSFKFNRIDKIFHEYFYTNLAKSIESIIDTLENTDSIINFNSLKELFHRKGVNMRLEWLVYVRLKRERSKVLVGADILARCLKKMISEKTSKKMSKFKKQAPLGYFEASAMKEKFDELLLDKNEFLIENLFKKLLCQALNILVRGTPEGPDNEDLFYAELTTDLFLHRMRILDISKRLIDAQSFDGFLSSETITNVINIACLHASVFFDAIEYHMKVGIAYEVKRQVRNDKYVFWVSTYGQAIKPQDINVIFSSETYLPIKDRCYLLLLKLLPSFPSSNPEPIELVVPSSLYKLRKSVKYEDVQTPGFECFLKEYYELPDLEILNDWGVLLESVLNGLYATDGEQTFLIEANIIQLVLAFFGENDGDNQHSLSILERINSFVTNSPVCSPELTIAIHTWFGIFSESKLFVECEQSYTVGLLALHKLYGDPRGRGALGTPWELFITWRLSILSRLQGKIHDAEYAEELYDATIMTLIDNPLSNHFKDNPIYRDPLRDYSNSQKDQSFPFPDKLNLKTLKNKEHPFPYWTNNLVFDENVSKIETINSTLQRTPKLLKWMITHIPTSQKTGVLWDTAYLRDFYLGIMQNSFSNTASVSSLSGISLDRKDKSSVTGGDGQSTPKSAMLKPDKKKDRLQGGNLVQMFEKDSSTLNKRELNGIVYSWGQNNEGQVGTPIGHVEEADLPSRRMRIYYPKSIVALKDTIIVSVSCGHTHSMAITLTRNLLAWGSNKSWQLGLGDKAPNQVFVPTPVYGIDDVAQVSCGSEHTVALTSSGLVYSWGQGEGGLLGHGDTQNRAKPTIIEGLREQGISSVVCGGLHTIALTKGGVCYSWGRGEGGQLGVSFDQLTHDIQNNELYLTVPKRVRGAIDGINIIQVACGDAHSLALAQNGTVYGWGYTSNGQLGLGVSSDTYTTSSQYGLQIKEPVLIEKLMNTKITDIFAGSLFSLFLNDKKELYGCGLNDYNQLGLEKVIHKYQQNQLDQYKQIQSGKNNESAVPKKIDCFTSMPILNVACGENHSLAVIPT
jgi:alpha-tubulin suppressor-like RCC1 family protein